ncbi:hypothetical protein NC653_002484 [Populus alba x Populus x berolinensis]|uniref:Uncharacterized protein n=1 Tax=Populus alba x Populus x berolinensis TaxID=444605 RepID=A0AAD6RQN6_9ROSI|nr:hypothetical protein NC653_002484 [Populus alba x Populus x berolinensis]
MCDSFQFHLPSLFSLFLEEIYEQVELEVSHVMLFTVYLSFFTSYGFWARGQQVLE